MPFSDARSRLLGAVTPMAAERVPIWEAAGRVLLEPLVADRMQPPFDRVMMDGFALRAAEWGRLSGFQVTGVGHAGQVAALLPLGAGNCIEVMTGASLPLGSDCVVPIEQVERRCGADIWFAADEPPQPGGFVHKAGSDVESGRQVVLPGRLIGAREIGVAASFGYSTLAVAKPPRIAIVATGDELVSIDARPLPHQIRQSNGHAIAAVLRVAGYPAGGVTLLGDDEVVAARVLDGLMEVHDWLILSGAVSKGARDFVPETLERLGCRRLFHGVAQRPGKPMGCWIGPAGQMLLALPGNPVSALTTLHVLALAALDHAAGRSSGRTCQVIMEGSVPWHVRLTTHLPVLINAAGLAQAVPPSNSGDFAGLLSSSGCVTLPPMPERLQPLPQSYAFLPWL